MFKKKAGGGIKGIISWMGVCIGGGEGEGGAVACEGDGEGEAVGNAVMEDFKVEDVVKVFGGVGAVVDNSVAFQLEWKLPVACCGRCDGH